MSSQVDEIEVLIKGISVKNVQRLQGKLMFDQSASERILHTTKRTIERCVKSKKPLTPAISEYNTAVNALSGISGHHAENGCRRTQKRRICGIPGAIKPMR